MLRMPSPSLGVAGLVGLGVLWLIPIVLLGVRVRRVWRRWSTPLPVIVPPLHHERHAAPAPDAFPRCLPDPSPIPRTNRLEKTSR